jgi:predicted heme/steroid binding protein
MTQAQPLRKFTLDELAQGDGREGRPALVGYEGRVYDCTGSKLWRNGKHVNAHLAGQDLSAHMEAAPHMDDVMARYPVVGVLTSAAPQALAETHVPPPALELLLAQHPHPITVHAPTAMGTFSAFFIVMHWVCGGPAAMRAAAGPSLAGTFELVAFWMVLVTALTAPVGTMTGLLSWWFNYRGVMTPLYRWKIGLSALLIALAWSATLIHIFRLGGCMGQAAATVTADGYHYLYALLVVAMAPTVIALGRFGGKIVYP